MRERETKREERERETRSKDRDHERPPPPETRQVGFVHDPWGLQNKTPLGGVIMKRGGCLLPLGIKSCETATGTAGDDLYAQ